MNKLQKKTLIIIRGYSGSGKTTVARLVATQLHMVMLERDGFVFGLLPYLSSKDESSQSEAEKRKEKNEVFSALCTVADFYMKLGRSIIIEGALAEAKEGERFDIAGLQSTAFKNGYVIISLILVADKEVCLARMEERGNAVKEGLLKEKIKALHDVIVEDEQIIDTSHITAENVAGIIKGILEKKGVFQKTLP